MGKTENIQLIMKDLKEKERESKNYGKKRARVREGAKECESNRKYEKRRATPTR